MFDKRTLEITYRFTYTADDCSYLGIEGTLTAMLTNAMDAIESGGVGFKALKVEVE